MTTATEIPTTGEELAKLGDSIQQAQRDRAAHQSAEQRRARARRSAERIVERLTPQIEALESQLSAMQPVADRLTERRAELAAKVESTPTPSAGDLRELDEVGEAVRQALTTGAPVVHGVSVHEQNGASVSGTPMRIRQPHPFLLAANPEPGFWTYGMETLRSELERLRAERAAAAQRLED